MNVATKSQIAQNRRQALANEHGADGNLFLVAADAVFYQTVRRDIEKGSVHQLHYVDCWTGIRQVTEFPTEVELYKFVAEFVGECDGPTEAFMRRFPLEFKEFGKES